MNLFPLVTGLLTKALPFLGKHWLTLVLVGLLGFTQVQNRQLLTTINQQKQEMAELRGAITQLSDAAKNLPVGKSTTIYVDRPVPYAVPGQPQIIETKVPVVVTRTETKIETQVKTIELPPKEIQTIIDKSPQTVVVNLEATRDIPKGEKFRVVVAQVQPGIWQGVLDLGSPVSATVTTVTPTERIPQPVHVSPWSFSLYSGYSTSFAFVTGLRAQYALNRNLTIEGSAEHRWAAPAGEEYRLLAIWKF